MEILLLTFAFAGGAIISYLIMLLNRQKVTQVLLAEQAKSTERDRFLQMELDRTRKESIDRLQKLEIELETERDLRQETQLEWTRLNEQLNQEQIRLKEHRAAADDLQKQAALQFESLATRLLDDKSQRFTEVNRLNMDAILNPLKEKITAFEQQVAKSYDQELPDKISLREEVKLLHELNTRISTEANNLARALKSDNKTQGNWGEFILERILERSGLREGESYTTQARNMNLSDEQGNRFRPDVIIHLPQGKHLVIDAKVSLLAYEQLVNAEDDLERDRFVRSHINSLKNHVSELSAKNYSQLKGLESPDFVLLFVPIESSFSVAVQADRDLFAYAWEKRVVIVSPSTLLATLQTISSVWTQERQNRNVLEIARIAGEMHDKFAGFVSDMELIDKSLRQSKDAYDKAMNKLSTGRGNLMSKALKVKSLGAKTSKELGEGRMVEEEDLEENNDSTINL